MRQAIVFCLCLTSSTILGAADQASWRLFRGDPQSTGVAKSKLPEDLSLHWKFEVKEGAFEGTPVIHDGVAYIGDLDGSVFALNLKDGKKK